MVRGLRNRHLILVDAVGVAIACLVAIAFRIDPVRETTDLQAAAIQAVLLVVAVLIPINIAFGLYTRDWRQASVGDMQRIVAAVATGTVVAAAIAWILGGMPAGFWPTVLLLALGVVGGSRFAIRVASDSIAARAARSDATGVELQRTLLYGAGHCGALMARSAERNPGAGVEPVGFLDDDPRLWNGRVAGIRVFGGLRTMQAAVAATGATQLLITMPSAKGDVVRRVVETAMGAGLTVRTVPALEQLLDGTVDAFRVRRVKVEDLLRRPMATHHAPAVGEIFSGKVVLITGAAGSIGSELARQVHALRPSRLILLDRSESPLYLVQRDLEERSALGLGAGEIVPRLGNVVSRTAMGRLVKSERPDVILHAAAYKHVPMLESHPEDAVQVNVAGTMSVLDAAVAAGVERFVLVSTDKAVKPSSVMGASKRIAEMLVLDAARRTGHPYVAVRFGNVLGSAGSVVPIFQEQLELGRPLTVTHPEMTRFFMTIPEAAWLILDAAAMGRAGDLFVLDMGEPVKVMDLARDVARLAGRDPESQEIQITGLRPGEKLHEELFYADEDAQPTDTPKVLRASVEMPPTDIRAQVRELILAASAESVEGLGAMVHQLAHAGHPGGTGRWAPDPSVTSDDIPTEEVPVVKDPVTEGMPLTPMMGERVRSRVGHPLSTVGS